MILLELRHTLDVDLKDEHRGCWRSNPSNSRMGSKWSMYPLIQKVTPFHYIIVKLNTWIFLPLHPIQSGPNALYELLIAHILLNKQTQTKERANFCLRSSSIWLPTFRILNIGIHANLIRRPITQHRMVCGNSA